MTPLGTIEPLRTYPLCHCEEAQRADVAISTPHFLHEIATSPAQPLATKEPYGCGVPLAGIRSSQ